MKVLTILWRIKDWFDHHLIDLIMVVGFVGWLIHSYASAGMAFVVAGLMRLENIERLLRKTRSMNEERDV